MKKIFKYLFISIIATLFIVNVVYAANTFPTTLNDWEDGDTIESGWADAIEDKIGVDSSGVVTSHDYLIRNIPTQESATSMGDFGITNVADIALDTISADDGSSFTISDNWTNAGNTVADLGSITTIDINGGTVDGISALTSSGDLDIGAHDFQAATLSADTLTQTRLVVVGADGLLSDATVVESSGALSGITTLTMSGTLSVDTVQDVGNDATLSFNGTNGVDVINAFTAGTVTSDGDVSGATIGGITEANLLDKTATETITGTYTFTNNITIEKANAEGTFKLHRVDASIGDNNGIGQIFFMADGSGESQISGASIQAQSDGAWTTDSAPGKLLFNTTPSGSEAPSTALLINNSQNFVFGGNTILNFGAPTTNTWIQISATGVILSTNDGNPLDDAITIAQNYYLDATDSRDEYIAADEASKYTQQFGKHAFSTATAGASANDPITWILGFTIQNDGSLLSLPTYSKDVGATTRDLLVDNTGLIGYQASSLRYKENVEDMDDYSKKIYDLRPVSFDWKSGKGSSYGLIAEEVEKIMPELVTYNEKGEVETVEYKRLIPFLLNEIQNLNQRIKYLKP